MVCLIMEYTAQSPSDTSTIITITGKLTFRDHDALKHMVSQLPINDEGFLLVLDLTEVEYIDSSALGMFVLIKETLGSTKVTLRLNQGDDQVTKALLGSSMDSVFGIEYR